MQKYIIIISIALAMSIIDVVTGYLCALVKKKVSSSVMRKGLIKKAVQMLVICVACLLQWGQTVADIGINIPVVVVTCVFLIWMETTSILENADKMLNGKLKNLISKILPKGKDNNEK